MFEMKLKSHSVNLKWGTWAMREFCLLKGIKLEDYFALLATSSTDLDLIVKLVFVGYKNACRFNKEEVLHNEDDVCDWIDEAGGIFVSEGPVVEYIKYIAESTLLDSQSNKKVEKKKA